MPERASQLDEYPDWTPTFVLELLQLEQSPLVTPKRREILEKLAIHPNMKLVWRRLIKRDSNLQLGVSPQLFFELDKALYGYNAAVEELTPSARKKKTNEIKSSLLMIANELDRYDIAPQCLSLFNGEELSAISINQESESSLVNELRKYLTPSLSTLLKRFSEELDATPIGSESVIGSKTKDNDMTRLIRHMGMFFKKSYGEYLYENISLLVEVFFDKKVDPSVIRKTIQATPREGGGN